ncbi:MAG TPA: hypothetical protein VLB44_03710 [Kofleriaceae bacterium]|nr:hypothetical protein [Kofleriaceae bacterium]
MIRSFLLVLALAPLAACASDTAQAKPAPASSTNATRASTDDPKALCVQTFTRARECTSDYIPALVDTRAKHDMPPGIAEQVKKDRDAVIKEAMDEWTNDSKDEAIAATCDKMSADVGKDPEMVATAKDCLAKPDCGAFSTCSMQLFEKHMSKKAP